MKKFAADNLMFLREHYPKIYELVRNKTADANAYAREPARNGQTNLKIRCEDGTVHYLYSKYNPELEAERWAESLESQMADSRDVLIVGFGLGYHLNAFLKTYPDKRIYVYEPDIQVLLAAIESVDLRETLSHRQIALLAVGHEEHVIFHLLLQAYDAVKSKFAYIIVPPYRRLYPEMDQRIGELISKSIRSYAANFFTISRFNHEMIENTIINLERVLRTPSFVPLRGICQGIPAIITGSGPSLDMEAEYLRKIRNQALIIAAGTSIMALLHHGIEPHLIISMDPGEANKRAFQNLNISHIPFLFITNIKYDAIRDDRSPYLMHGFFLTDVISKTLLDLTDEDGVFFSTSSVVGTAVQMAVYLGCTEITLIGQDLSYPDNQTYSKGIRHVTDKWVEGTLRRAKWQVRNVKGGYNRTTDILQVLKTDFENVLKVYPDIRFYNASPIGAAIEGTVCKSLQELFDPAAEEKIPEGWFKEQMRLRLKPYPPERVQNVKHRLSQVLRELDRMEQSIEKLSGHLSQHAHHPDWFTKFEKIWSAIVGHEIYKEWFTYFLAAEDNHARRYWPDMLEEKRLEAKRIKLEQCVMPLIRGMRKLLPLMIRHMKELQTKLAEKE